MSARNMAKRTAAGTLALAVCLGGGALALAGAANADANFKFDRIAAGTDRFDTAIQSSKTAFPSAGQAGGVVLVNGWRSVDGLTASSLAGAYQASILYSETDAVPQATRDEINRLGTKNIWLVGGTTVLSSQLEADLKSAGFTVNRIGGSDRYETAAKVSDATMAKTGKKPSHVFVASGIDGNLSDSTIVAPIAYATGSPILLSEPGDAPKYTTDQLDDVKGAAVHIVGGTKALSDSVYNEVGAKDRFAGSDRGQTANYVADWAKANAGFSVANAALVGAANSNVADSLASAAFLGNAKTNIFYAGLDTTNTYLRDHANVLTGKGWVIGGKAVVSDDAIAAAAKAAQTVTSNQSFSVAGGTGLATVSTGTDGVGVVQYTVSGLSSTKVYVALVAKGDVNIDSNGVVTFKSSATAGFADLTAATNAKITVVNGVATGGVTITGAPVSPTNGSITFSTDSSTADSAIPVVFSAADNNGTLSLKTTTASATTYGAPTEAFAVGGKQSWVPVSGSLGSIASASPTAVDVSSKYFIQGSKTYRWDGNDTFQYQGASISADDFATLISTGATLSGSYNPTSAATSVFNITAVTGVSTTAPTASAVNGDAGSYANDAKVVYTPASTDPSGVAYELTRSTTSGGTYTTVSATKSVDSAGVVTFMDNNLGDGTYYYKVKTTYPVTGTVVSTSASSVVTVASPAVQPKSTYAAETTATGLNGTLDGTDVLTVAFDRAMTVPTSGIIQVKDADGTIVNLVIGGGSANATVANPGGAVTLGGTTYPANQVLVFTLSGAPTVVQAGTTTGATFPLTIVDSSNIASTGGALWNLGASTDVSIEQ